MTEQCIYGVCPKGPCALEDVLVNPTATDPKIDDRAASIHMLRRCPNISLLKKRFPELFRKANQ